MSNVGRGEKIDGFSSKKQDETIDFGWCRLVLLTRIGRNMNRRLISTLWMGMVDFLHFHPHLRWLKWKLLLGYNNKRVSGLLCGSYPSFGRSSRNVLMVCWKKREVIFLIKDSPFCRQFLENNDLNLAWQYGWLLSMQLFIDSNLKLVNVSISSPSKTKVFNKTRLIIFESEH